MTINLIPRDKTNTPLKVKSIQWQEYFSFLNNYVADGLELSSLSPTDISIGIGAGRINGLIVIVDSAEAVTVTGNGTRYCHLHIVRANLVDPSSVEIVFLDAKSDDKDYLFIGSAVANGDGTGFDVDMLDVPRDMGIRNDFFGDGRDGDVVLANGDSIDSDMQYRNLKITGTVSVANNISIVVKENCEIDGTLVCRGIVLGGAGGHGTRGTRVDPIRGDGISGSVGNAYENIIGVGSNGTGIQNGGSSGSGVIGVGAS